MVDVTKTRSVEGGMGDANPNVADIRDRQSGELALWHLFLILNDRK